MFKTKVILPALTALVVGVAVLSAPAVAKNKDKDDVAAIVDGEKIMKKDVLAALENLPVKGADKAQIYPLVLGQIINEKLIDRATKAAKLESTEEFKNRLDALRGSLLKQMYVEKFLRDKVTDNRVKAEYARFKKENSGKEEIRARHVLVPSAAEAEQVIKDLDAGGKFEDIAQKRSSGPTAQNGGDVGYFAKEDMLPEFSEAAFALKVGSYTKKPVKTQFGYHVIKVEDKRKRQIPPIAEIEGAIRNKLGQEALEQLVEDLRVRAKIEEFDINGKKVTPKKN